MAFKKDLTKFSAGKKGTVTTNRGKGSTTQRTAPREQETLTGGEPMQRAMNTYPAAPQPAPTPSSPADLAVAPAAPMPGAGVPVKPV